LTDKVWRPYATVPGANQDGFEIAALAHGISLESLSNRPSLITNTNINSPLKFDDAMADGLIAMSRMGQVVVVSSFTLAGAMAPITLEGTLMQQNAEVLSGVVLAQIVRHGSPVVYGSFTSNVDMKTGSPSLGTPEYTKMAIVSGQLARKYKLPYRTSNASSSNIVDAQSIYESQMSIWGALLGGVDILFQGHGWMESGLTTSFEKFIIDSEMLQMVTEAMKPLSISDDSLAIDVVDKVGPGGHFFGTDHTLARYKDAFYQPMVSDWRNFESWEEDGGFDSVQRANKIWKQILHEYEPPYLDESKREAIAAYVPTRKKQLS
jgi:trimethylamine--corrinoid protein Co-methyltransferase